MIVIELFSGKDCPLCEEAKAILHSAQKDFEFVLKEIVLLPGSPHYEKYKEHIPVVHINGSFSFRHHIDEASVRRELRILGATQKKIG